MPTNQLTTEIKTKIAEQKTAVPTKPSERIIALDALRGFAILGILVMNIQSFSMVVAAYQNPLAYGNFTGLNRWVWMFSHIFFDLKFMAMFSMMFGAGIILITTSAEKKGVSPAKLHYKRNFWLLLFGLAHAYLFWSGDILTTYAICGFIVYVFRKLSPKWLALIGVILFAIPSAALLLGQMSIDYIPVEQLNEMSLSWQPTAEMVADEIAVFQGGWLEQMALRIPHSLKMQTYALILFSGWRVCGMMLIGMALFKWGVLTAKRSLRFYAIMMLVGFLLGFPLVVVGVKQNFVHDWEFLYGLWVGSQFNYWGSLLVSFGYIGMVMLIAKAGWIPGVVKWFASVGRMALTNYFLQTIICTTIFYGHGLGLFGQVERTGQLLLVFAVWVVQLIISPVWLKRYRFGPFEWLWRSLTYWQKQPM